MSVDLLKGLLILFNCKLSCFQDPRKLHPVIKMLMESQLTSEGGSFGDSSRLYVLQGALAQQEWRVPSVLHKFLDLLKSNLSHPYKIVRDRIGSVLVNIFLYDIPLPSGVPTTSPKRADFLAFLQPQLEVLTNSFKNGNGNGVRPDSTSSNAPSSTPSSTPSSGSQDVEMKPVAGTSDKAEEESADSEERKTAVKVIKTAMKWLQVRQ